MSAMRLCQYEEGPPTVLAPTHRVTISSWEVEHVVQSHLSPEAPLVEIQLRYDPHLLDARRPSAPTQTILGIWEEDELAHVDLHVTVWEPTSYGENENTASCNCQAPHSMWTRAPMVSKSSSQAHTTQVKWVDVRDSHHHLSLTTQGACCHFLRSLLGTSHGAMPWGHKEEAFLAAPSVVVLVLPREAGTTLTEFRTGDACPSYFLHSVSQLQLPSNNATWWIPEETHVFGDETTSDAATLLIYRTIPPRDNLLTKHPLAPDEKLPDGCLWERVRKHEEGDDESKDDCPKEEEEEDLFRPLGPPYVSYKQDYPNLLEPLLNHLDTLREEALSIPQWTAWPERQHYHSSSADDGDDDGIVASWTVFPLCHCFPAHQVENRKWIDVTCAHVPKTMELLKNTLGDTLRTALFSRLDPETTLEAHTGWQDLANHVLRVHIPLVVPSGGLCGMWVDGCVETHQTGRPLCFDDAKVHRAFNYSKEERIVLILDLLRPSYLPVGTATGGHTEELDEFIAQLNAE